MDTLNAFTGVVRRAVDDYGMIQAGDRIAVGISGGKDSMVLLSAMKHLQTYYPKPFELSAITIEIGFPDMDYGVVAEYCAGLGVPYIQIKTDIREIVFDIRKESNPCSLCAKMRRGALNTAMKEHGFNKLALGHHFDDAVETFMMSLLFEGRLNCFKPVTYMSRMDVTQIRPMVYAGELRIANLAESLGLPVVHNTCPEDESSKRAEIKALLAGMAQTYPDLKSKVFGAMQRLPIDGWGTGKIDN